MTGETIGKYRILGRLGSGGMGTVYRAFDETLERDVAIKVLNPGLTDPQILKRFRIEATTLAKLNHPAVATIYELFQYGEELLIVMEYLRGETLEKLALRLGRLTPDQAVFVVDRVLSALAHSHRAGIVHCDIKPANVMVTVQGEVKVMDFGTARARGADRARVQGYMMGTPAYMPPEQLLGQNLDGRTDLYAVGVLFYRLVTGNLPFTAGTPIETMRKQIADAPTPALAYCPDLSGWCDLIVQRALSKLPDDRFQTADEFRDALREASGIVTTELTKVLPAPVVDVVDADASPRLPMIVEPFEAVTEAIGAAPEARAPVVFRVTPSQAAARVVRRPLAGVIAVAAALMAVTTLRAPLLPARPTEPTAPAAQSRPTEELSRPEPPVPTEAPAPAEPQPGGQTGDDARAAFTFQARVVGGDEKSSPECKCRVVLGKGRITWRAEGNRGRVYSVAYDHIASMAYSRGRDPLWSGPGGPTPVVRANHGAFGALGFFAKRDWLSLRVKEPRLRFIVLRFDDPGQVVSVIDALEERTGRQIERLSRPQLVKVSVRG